MTPFDLGSASSIFPMSVASRLLGQPVHPHSAISNLICHSAFTTSFSRVLASYTQTPALKGTAKAPLSSKCDASPVSPAVTANDILIFIYFYLTFLGGAMSLNLQDRSSLTRDRTCASEVEVQGPNHWTAGEFKASSSLESSWMTPFLPSNFNSVCDILDCF